MSTTRSTSFSVNVLARCVRVSSARSIHHVGGDATRFEVRGRTEVHGEHPVDSLCLQSPVIDSRLVPGGFESRVAMQTPRGLPVLQELAVVPLALLTPKPISGELAHW